MASAPRSLWLLGAMSIVTACGEVKPTKASDRKATSEPADAAAASADADVTEEQLAATGVDVHGAAVFDANFYLRANADLATRGIKTPAQAAKHWTASGIMSGRQGCATFHTTEYLENYPKLKKQFGNAYGRALIHYLQVGRKQGLLGTRAAFLASGKGPSTPPATPAPVKVPEPVRMTRQYPAVTADMIDPLRYDPLTDTKADDPSCAIAVAPRPAAHYLFQQYVTVNATSSYDGLSVDGTATSGGVVGTYGDFERFFDDVGHTNLRTYAAFVRGRSRTNVCSVRAPVPDVVEGQPLAPGDYACVIELQSACATFPKVPTAFELNKSTYAIRSTYNPSLPDTKMRASACTFSALIVYRTCDQWEPMLGDVKASYYENGVLVSSESTNGGGKIYARGFGPGDQFVDATTFAMYMQPYVRNLYVDLFRRNGTATEVKAMVDQMFAERRNMPRHRQVAVRRLLATPELKDRLAALLNGVAGESPNDFVRRLRDTFLPQVPSGNREDEERYAHQLSIMMYRLSKGAAREDVLAEFLSTTQYVAKAEPARPTCELRSSRFAPHAGDSVTLTAIVRGGDTQASYTSGDINGQAITLATGSTVTVSGSTTTTYTATARHFASGTGSCTVRVPIVQAPFAWSEPGTARQWRVLSDLVTLDQARQQCGDLGSRLPTLAEIQAAATAGLLTNPSFGDVFSASEEVYLRAAPTTGDPNASVAAIVERGGKPYGLLTVGVDQPTGTLCVK